MADRPTTRDGSPDPVATARREVDEADRLLRSGRLDDAAARELEIAIAQLRADLTNGENPDASLERIRHLTDGTDAGPSTGSS